MQEDTHETEARESEVATGEETENTQSGQPQDEEPQVEQEGEEESQSEDDGSTKKLSNALNKQKRANNKLRAQREQAQQEIERLKKQLESSGESEAEPKEDAFDSYSDYLKARADWAGKSSFSEHSRKNTEEQINNLESQKETLWANERVQHLNDKVKQVSAEYSDYMDIHKQNVETVNKLPTELQKTFLAADNAPMAFYNLVKEGRLDDLQDMPVEAARAEIIQAQYRNPPKPKQATNAPAPIKGATGKGKQHKSLADYDPKEIVKWAKQ